MKIFIVSIEDAHCGCGLEERNPCCSFSKREDAEDFCTQFNALNKLPENKDGEPNFESRQAVISEIHLFEKPIKYELSKTTD